MAVTLPVFVISHEAMRLLGDEAMSLEARGLKHWYNQVLEDNTEKIAAVKEIFERLGARPLCELVVDDYTNKALELLNTLPQNAATEQLRQLANKLTTRKD